MGRVPNEEKRSKSMKKGAERSAYFARREAAKVLRVVLEGDAKRRALASIKSLIYKPSIRNKKATFALICQTLKRIVSNSHSSTLFIPLPFFNIHIFIPSCLVFIDLPIIKDVLEASSILNTKWKVHIVIQFNLI